MNVESYVCDKCGRHCKDKRGLTIHSRACQGIQNLVCEFCNTTFSSAYCLATHTPRCTENKKQRQEQTESLKEELEKLREKLKTVELARQEELKNCKIKLQNEYESQLKLRDDDLKNTSKKLDVLKREVKAKEQDSAKLTAELSETRVYLRSLQEINAKLSLKERNTTIINNNDNRVQVLQCFDPSMIQGKIQPPNYVIGNVNDLVLMLRSLGVRNCFRVNDKSRGTLSWNKPGEGEIRDPNGEQLLTHIIDSLSTDITYEKSYYEEELKKLCDTDEPDLYQINESRIFVNFCSQLLRKDPEILNKIKKELVKQGRDKGDTEFDEVQEVSYYKFITSILTALFPRILIWIEMTFYELGRYLGKRIKDHYHLEGASKESLYIVVHTDRNGHKQVSSKKLMFYISEAIEKIIDSEITEQMLHEILLYKAINRDRVEAMLSYLKNPTLEETDEIMKGIVSL
jgi:hypothetical protein